MEENEDDVKKTNISQREFFYWIDIIHCRMSHETDYVTSQINMLTNKIEILLVIVSMLIVTMIILHSF